MPAPFRHLAHVSPFERSPVVFLTVCTRNRAKILANAACHALLVGLWERSAARNGWFVGRYVVMADHVHLFAGASPDADPMPDWIKMWKSTSARQIAAIVGRHPPIWQPDYFDRYLRSNESYAQKWDYVRENPVRANLVQQADLWPFAGMIHDLRRE